jgi:hypothetical protein
MHNNDWAHNVKLDKSNKNEGASLATGRKSG